MEKFSALLAICAANSPVPGEFPAQRLVMQSFDVFFDLRLNKRLITLLHPELTPWWSFLLADVCSCNKQLFRIKDSWFLIPDGVHHKKPHSPTHPTNQKKVRRKLVREMNIRKATRNSKILKKNLKIG